MQLQVLVACLSRAGCVLQYQWFPVKKTHFHLAALSLAGFSQIKFIQHNSCLPSFFPPFLETCLCWADTSNISISGLRVEDWGLFGLLISTCCGATKPMALCKASCSPWILCAEVDESQGLTSLWDSLGA